MGQQRREEQQRTDHSGDPVLRMRQPGLLDGEPIRGQGDGVQAGDQDHAPAEADLDAGDPSERNVAAHHRRVPATTREASALCRSLKPGTGIGRLELQRTGGLRSAGPRMGRPERAGPSGWRRPRRLGWPTPGNGNSTTSGTGSSGWLTEHRARLEDRGPLALHAGAGSRTRPGRPRPRRAGRRPGWPSWPRSGARPRSPSAARR